MSAFARTIKLFDDRILAFDKTAALAFAEMAIGARSKGRGFPTPDGYIAAIASAHDFAVATRDVAPFLAGGIEVINPWEDQ
jgi:predicted nucleic acid-binding protein